ncbi:conserved hypothetical protein [Talaromyces stipitatus ATCC 10500]|uniref:FAD binding domain protein n=1 Tax=Talaromyces stipitatus (strain ATCC 10500 / CBS 375.48 / QM 6759 / NRRL 1006) TaxID=441959 RepID=B8LVR5_TALSN|nr:uncharacterized protein TSTA_075670 [Talaromyces stipitatus ATCC 10500]EED24195.1 conserved hypothetical protein [Talaromyces stipitatus ATCC 10500]
MATDSQKHPFSARGAALHGIPSLREYNEDTPEWPPTEYIKNNASSAIQVCLTKYILGSDGARSAIRQATGVQSSSRGSEDAWAVVDVYVDTKFPDYRRRCAIRTPDGGCVLIPRKDEGLRIFLQIDENGQESLGANGHRMSSVKTVPSNSPISSSRTLKSQYCVAQRVVHKFCDQTQRVFLLKDTCHTHSPKAGQEMNVSISNSYRVTWRLALVLKGIANPALLQTYQQERLWVAKQLIESDAQFARQVGRKRNFKAKTSAKHGNRGMDSQVVWRKAVEPLTPGRRLLPIDAVRHIDGNHAHLLDVMPSNGRFHLFIFAGNQLLPPMMLGDSLDSSQFPMSLFNLRPLELMERFRHEDITTDPDSTTSKLYVLDLFLIHSIDHLSNPLEGLPAPFSTKWSMRVYSDISGAAQNQLGFLKTLVSPVFRS